MTSAIFPARSPARPSTACSRVASGAESWTAFLTSPSISASRCASAWELACSRASRRPSRSRCSASWATIAAVGSVGGLAAQLRRGLQRGRVGDAGQERFNAGGVQDDLLAVVLPAGGQLRLAVRDGDDLDALAAGVR